MARQEVPKEDLVRDATAFAVRIEFRRSPDDPAWIFVGLRADGGGSVYFGDDEFYAFNTKNELRRAFVDGRLLKAENRRLIAMRRERSDGATFLASEPVESERESQALATLASRVAELKNALERGEFPVSRSAGEAAADRASVQQWLANLADRPIAIAERPNSQ